MPESSRVVVTGGDGYLGRRVVQLLGRRGATIMIVDDGRLAREPDELMPGATRLVQDFASPDALSAIRKFEPTGVFHLAATHFVPDCDRDPVGCLSNNVLGTERLFSALRDTRVESVVFCSSAVVYGFAETPRREEDELRPAHVYAHSKWLGEGLLRALQEDRPSIRAIAARMFNLIGPDDTAMHVVPEIVAAVGSGRVPQLGNTWPRRDYIHIEDVARALLALADGPATFEAVNVGTGQGRSVQDVLNCVGSILGREAQVRIDPARQRSIDGHLVADISLILQTTDWTPRWTFEETVAQLLKGATG